MVVQTVVDVWATVAFAKRIEGVGEILTMLNKELTEEEIDQSIRILTEIYNDHPEMLGGQLPTLTVSQFLDQKRFEASVASFRMFRRNHRAFYAELPHGFLQMQPQFYMMNPNS